MGTNLSQVFVSNALTVLSGTTFNSSGATSDDVGLWKLDATAGYLETKALIATVAEADTSGAVAGTALVSPLWLIKDFQIVQRAVTGNWIASPMINTGNVKRISYTAHVATVPEFTTVDIANGTITGDELNLKVVIRTSPTDYQNFVEPGNAINDITGGGKTCPIGISNATNHKSFNITSMPADRLAETAAADTELGLYDDLLTKINAHAILGDLLKGTDGAGSGLKLETRFATVSVEMILTNVTDSTTTASHTVRTAFVPGSGNDWQVAADEKRCRSKQGHFNRMYLPTAIDTYVTNGYFYDKVVIEYAHNWPSATGIAPAGDLNQLTIYYSNEGSDPGTTTTQFDDVFGYVANTDKEYTW